MKNTILTMLCLLLLFAGPLSAQKPNPFTAKTKGKVKVMYDFPTEGRNSKTGGGYSANLELLPSKPKKIALVSFYLYDPAKGKTTGGVYSGTATASVWRTTDAQGQAHVDGFYANSIETLKSTFKANGMDLLTPEEFLDTDDKAQFFYGFNQETAKREKTTVTVRNNAGTSISTIAEASVGTLKVCPTGKGYRAFMVANEQPNESDPAVFKGMGVFGANRKMTSSLGYELCQGLGVDAVAVCYIVTRKLKMNKDDHGVNAVNLFVFGPNPKSEGGDDANRGQFYCGTRVFYQNPLLFHLHKGGASYAGMDNVLKASADKLCKYMNDTK